MNIHIDFSDYKPVKAWLTFMEDGHFLSNQMFNILYVCHTPTQVEGVAQKSWLVTYFFFVEVQLHKPTTLLCCQLLAEKLAYYIVKFGFG